jgi:hypothetical protein
MAAQVGLDPIKDIRWITDPSVKPIELFVQGKIDAFLGFPPESQDLDLSFRRGIWCYYPSHFLIPF